MAAIALYTFVLWIHRHNLEFEPKNTVQKNVPCNPTPSSMTKLGSLNFLPRASAPSRSFIWLM